MIRPGGYFLICNESDGTDATAKKFEKIIDGMRCYWDCCWQYYVLFLGAEFFDWLVIDTIWVALSDWWLIPGTEDLNDTWHSTKVKRWKMVKLIPASVPVAVVVGGLCWLVGRLAG